MGDINSDACKLHQSVKTGAAEMRLKLFEDLANLDHEIEDYFLMEEFPPLELVNKVVRRLTLECAIVPVYMGSAFKNKGVQPVLDAVCEYLPKPTDNERFGFVLNAEGVEEEVRLKTEDSSAPFVGLAFKLETNK